MFNQNGEIIEMQVRNGIFDKIFINGSNPIRDGKIQYSKKYYLIVHQNKILEIAH